MNEVRKYTIKLIELCEEGIITKEQVFNELMSYLSEEQIKEFCLEGFGGELRHEGLFKELEEDKDD